MTAKHWMPALRIGIGLTCFGALTLDSAETASNPEPPSHVENHTFISPNNPKIRVKVDKRLDYIGEVPFTIDNVAALRICSRDS